MSKATPDLLRYLVTVYPIPSCLNNEELHFIMLLENIKQRRCIFASFLHGTLWHFALVVWNSCSLLPLSWIVEDVIIFFDFWKKKIWKGGIAVFFEQFKKHDFKKVKKGCACCYKEQQTLARNFKEHPNRKHGLRAIDNVRMDGSRRDESELWISVFGVWVITLTLTLTLVLFQQPQSRCLIRQLTQTMS